ncbi:alkaline phosphatase D family protein [Novipirellula herctigrandis]
MTTRLNTLLIFVALSGHAFAQHDPGRNAVRLLAEDQFDEAIELVGKEPRKQNSPISESDRCFVLAMIACRQGDLDEAFDLVQQAINQGLPMERLLAGPREFLEPLASHPPYIEWIASKKKRLLHGPMLGSITDTSAKFWVRTADELNVDVVVQTVSETKEFKGTGQTSKASDFTTTISVSGLSPDTQYQYEVLIDGQNVCPSAKFRTFPQQGNPCRVKIAFGGGAGFTPQYESMWKTLKSRDVNAMLLLGDNVYVDDPTHSGTWHYCYYRRQSQPDWRRLVASVGVFSIYDDHDFAENDCVPGPHVEKPEWKREVWNTFTQNWVNPAYGNGVEQPGCWYDFYIGDIHFIMLDGRYYRDLKGGSMLGPVQKKWLQETLKSSTGKFKVLASPVPFSPGVKPGSKDTWDGFPSERESIFAFIEEHQINGVILMAADRHRSDMRRIPRPNGYALYEVMSSRLTNVHTHNLLQDAKGSEFIIGYNDQCSFGQMEFDTTSEDPFVAFTIVNIDNQPIESRTLKLSELTCPISSP